MSFKNKNRDLKAKEKKNKKQNVKNVESLTEEDIKYLMSNRVYRRVRGSIQQIK